LDGQGETVDLSKRPSSAQTEQLVRHTVTVSTWPVVEYFLEQPVPDGWKRHPLLRNHRTAVFSNGVCTLPGTHYTLRLSRGLGLESVKEGQ
jgi:hypothetical protein